MQLRGLARKTKDGPQARRLLALAAIYDGATRTEAAKIGGVGPQIIPDWVLRFNPRGSDGPWQLLPNGRPVLLQIATKLINRHPVDTCATLFPLLPQCFLQV